MQAEPPVRLTSYADDFLRATLKSMALIRSFESHLPALNSQSLLHGSSHSSAGQEAVAVGACFALRKDDYVTSTHRGHGHAIAKGGDVRLMMAELLGRSNGYCRGKGGSMHIADFSIGMLGANGVVGSGIGIATGAALSISLRKTDQVVLCFFGEGAINQGILFECANMAALWKLPILFLCENNQFSMSTRPHHVTSTLDLPGRLSGLGIPGISLDGTDVIAVYEAVAAAVQAMRAGVGPQFIEAKCYRFSGHFGGDGLKYRSKEELEQWLSRDPITQFRSLLEHERRIAANEAEQILSDAASQIEQAVAFAQSSPFPDTATLWEDVYA